MSDARTRRLRLFVAVRPGPAALAQLTPQVDAARGALSADALAVLRPVPAADWHVTLQFLGAVAPDDVDRVRLACAFGAGRLRPFPVTYEGLGAFPSVRRARHLWAAVTDGADALAALATAVQAQTAKLGWEPGGRAYVPHLTIARAAARRSDGGAEPADVEPVVSSCVLGPVRDDVGEIVLYRSHSAESPDADPAAPDAVRYEVVDTFPLQT